MSSTPSEHSDIDEDDDYLDEGDQKFEDDDDIDEDDDYEDMYYDQEEEEVEEDDEQMIGDQGGGDDDDSEDNASLILQVLNAYMVGRGNNDIMMNINAANTSHADLTRELFGQRNLEPIRLLHHYIPDGKNPKQIVRQNSRVFCCRYANDGKTFMTASQDQKIRFYDTTTWKERNMVHARYVSWSIIDTDFSQDQQFFIYSSWSPYIHICNTNGEDNTHIALDLEPNVDERFCIFGLKFSPGGSEILGGSSDGFIYLYDLNESRRILEVRGHLDDINSVTYLDRSGNVFATGSDDFNINIWDKRMIGLGGGSTSQISDRTISPVGVLTGHTRGVTHVSSKEDGTYFVSNAKDETAKLWDIRKMNTKPSTTNAKLRSETAYDRYQFPQFPVRPVDKTPDLSIQTYRGHQIRQTLVRCYFSPIETTAQKYIYTGSSDGRVYIYDVLTGALVQTLYKDFTIRDYGGRLIRDLAWHPHSPEIVSTNWNGDIILWDSFSDARDSFKKQQSNQESSSIDSDDNNDNDNNNDNNDNDSELPL
ncbi:WD40 repeat-containing protein [Cavenderia fasciculata]|uniref:WD40 repeat-containing protein n=1 Tax=Cavenderia fasciculata TaxID=261658 RepID=F4Q142_CACFS|nr:WD40 repeat-containing protein [Cavenderia fasciculata]EGG18543.1 WD40 repeat-containing protein [Cavenderia fasciculata]|eukprot:XP_004366447.1 WD40 repeat-containing protein [Cavenderia fasciculata]